MLLNNLAFDIKTIFIEEGGYLSNTSYVSLLKLKRKGLRNYKPGVYTVQSSTLHISLTSNIFIEFPTIKSKLITKHFAVSAAVTQHHPVTHN